MSDAYQIGDVTVTPTGGGWYELTASSLAEPEKIQGKENADARASEIATPKADDGGTMQGQGSLDDALGQQEQGTEDEVAALKEKLAAAQTAQAEDQAARLEAERRADEAEKKLATKTVVTDGGEVPTPAGKVPAGIPRRYEGKLDDKEKSRLARAGLNIVTIVLEENETIPPTGLYLGHNGRGYVIVPGEEVDVPDFLLNVLNDAVMSAPVVDNKTQKVLGYRNRLRYPYRKI